MTSTLKVQNIQYTDGDAALTIADGGGVTANSNLTVSGAFTSQGIDDNADANAITIDSSENITIGTAGTGASSTSPKYLSLGSTFSSVAGDHPKLKLYEASDGNEIGIGISSNQMDFQGTSTDFDYVFYSNGNKLMHVNGTGEITKPQQPCFRASGLGGAWSTGINDVVHFANDGNGFNFDIGNNYNTSSNGFFAPVAGKYQFYAQALIQNGTNQKRIKLRKNGTDFAIGNVYGYNSSSEVTVWVAGIVNMAVNDKIDVHLNTVSGNYYNHHPYTFFQGFLIG